MQASPPHSLNLCGSIFASFLSSIVCFSDYVEELGHPYMWVQNLGGLQFPLGASEVGVYPYCHPIGAQILTLTGIMLAHSCSFPGCLQWQFPECRPDGENHEAAQATTPVPLSFTQTVCLTGYVPYTTNRLNNLQRYSDLIVLVSSEHSIIPVSSECLYLFPAKIMSRLARWVTITYEEYRVCIVVCMCACSITANVCNTKKFHILCPCRNCLIHNMSLMLGWQRRLICILWVWWRGAQVSLCAADYLPTLCLFKSLNENPCLKLTRVCSLPPGRRGAESPLPRGLSSVLPVPQLEGGA